ncbi:MBL fold metallo-hydrolase [Pedobacter sp. SD-b]|uniref:MBL fold metallo-hydrolase n=1 Tax=Pedobacter segetis TaxID=2793069 RepID=A0ABS1BGN8_9SPHI|nr:MBL fold metallo-hydrolase [Pedobacter segetis]MBK0381551.1 MBL fold metallo-hydrolase [Pedobacter segetis]
MKVTALHEGSYSVDVSKKFIPFDPLVDKASDRPASLFIFIQPFLVETKEDLILLDTGLGYNDEKGASILHQNIINAGYQPSDVTKVLMSHLHYDHSGGMVLDKGGKLEVSFANAEYYIQRGEWETAYSKKSTSYKTEIFDVLQRSGQIHFLEGDGKINDWIGYEVTGGHTQFHQVFLIQEDGEQVFFGADIAPEPEQLQRKFIAKYDLDGRKAMELRTEYGEKAILNNWICLFYHAKAKAISKVLKKGDAIFIEEVKG